MGYIFRKFPGCITFEEATSSAGDYVLFQDKIKCSSEIGRSSIGGEQVIALNRWDLNKSAHSSLAGVALGTASWQSPMSCSIRCDSFTSTWDLTGTTSSPSTKKILSREWRKTLRGRIIAGQTSSARAMLIIWTLRMTFHHFSIMAHSNFQRMGRTCCLFSMDCQGRLGLSLMKMIHSLWLMRWDKKWNYLHRFFPWQVELGMTYGCQLSQKRILQYVHFNRYHTSMIINKLRKEITDHLRMSCVTPWTKLSTGCYL